MSALSPHFIYLRPDGRRAIPPCWALGLVQWDLMGLPPPGAVHQGSQITSLPTRLSLAMATASASIMLTTSWGEKKQCFSMPRQALALGGDQERR